MLRKAFRNRKLIGVLWRGHVTIRKSQSPVDALRGF